MSGILSYQSITGKSGILGPFPSFLVWWHGSAALADPIIYNDDSTGTAHNTGGHYSTSTGKFTAPVSGLYSFSWGGIKGTSTSVAGRFALMKNTNISGLNEVRLEESSQYACGYCTQVLPLVPGDYITVKVTGTVPWVGGSWSSNSPFFTGHLIS